MELETKKVAVYEKLLPVAGLVLAALALAGQGYPEWVRYAAIAIGVVLAVAWLFSQTGWVGRAIKFWLYRSKLSKDQAARLSVLLDDISNHMSYLYTLSPFYVWQDCANRYVGKIRMNQNYHGAIHVWLLDLKERLSDPRNDTLLLIGSLSKAVSEATTLAEQVERDLHELLLRDDLTDADRTRIRKSWDSARNHFNQWIDKWQSLFKEVMKTADVSCVQYFRPLEMIG